jgi:hypothetical protein
MPNEALENVLNRDLSRVVAKPLIDRYCPLFDEIVNYGTNLYARATHGIQDMLSETGVPKLIYLNVLEMTDATSEMLRQSTVTPAIPVIRSTFESSLDFEYMFDVETTNRAHAWLVAYVIEQIEWANMMLGVEKEGQQFHQAMKTDSVGANINLASYQVLATKQKTDYEAILNKPELAAAVAERDALVKKNPRNQHPHWYSSFGGPGNLRQLSKLLDREAQYLALYKYFSGVAHGQNLRRFISRKASPDPLTRLIRDSSEFERLTEVAMACALRCSRLLSKQVNETQQYSTWYAREIKPGYAPDPP